MNIEIGKYKGESVETVVLKHPDYVIWVLSIPSPTGQLAEMKIEMERLIEVFDRKPFKKRCSDENCGKPATRFTIHGRFLAPFFWCDGCDPYRSGAVDGKLSEIRTYREALKFCDIPDEHKINHQVMITKIARAKGLPDRARKEAVEAFFL